MRSEREGRLPWLVHETCSRQYLPITKTTQRTKSCPVKCAGLRIGLDYEAAAYVALRCVLPHTLLSSPEHRFPPKYSQSDIVNTI